MTETSPPPGPVTASDVTLAVRSAIVALRAGADADWSVPAGDLEWDCRETADHIADDLFAYAVQLGPQNPPRDTHVPFGWAQRRPGGPAVTVYTDPSGGIDAVLQVMDASGALLSAMVATASPDLRSHHVHGVADPEGFAAMGVVETLIHTHDIATGLGVDWQPDPALCARATARLFPDAPTDTDAWSALLWCAGRAALPDRPRLTEWRWWGAPRTD